MLLKKSKIFKEVIRMISERLEKIKLLMKEHKLDVYYITTSDDHMSEYIPEYYKVLRYFSGFTGSLGTLLITLDKSYLFVDGRYHIQADEETRGSGIEVMHLGLPKVLEPLEFLKTNYEGKTIGLDGKLTSTTFVNMLTKQGNNVVSIDLASGIMEDRTPLSKDMLFSLDESYCGKSTKDKLKEVKYCLSGKTHILTNLESIAYLLNLRGNDIANTPVFLSFMVFTKDDVYLFINKERLSEEILMRLYDDGIAVREYDEYYDFIKEIKNQIVLIDENKVNYETRRLLDKSNKVFNMTSVVEEMKAIKNPVEQENSRLAHIYDGVAMLRFMMWLKKADKTLLDECDVVEKLNAFRLGYRSFDLSFKPIVAYNANAAMMHYSPKKDKCAKLNNEGILLVDSGGQYFEGTTDITRTFALGPVSDEVRKYFTIVLKSMFELSEVVFKKGMSGYQLDILARKELWSLGIDYLCGTGHGVGHVLAVHEMPPNIRYQKTVSASEQQPLVPGNITSDEPGVYFENKYGIRCENMLLVKKAFENEYGEFFKFETLTMCPFDLDLIDMNYLDEKNRIILNTYHAQVRETLSPYLNEEEKDFLNYATREI